MIISSPELRAEFRAGDCEWCHRRGPGDAAHVFACGLGSRIDDRLTLVSLCRECHTLSHNANSSNGVRPNHEDLVGIVCRREGVTAEALWEWVCLVRRLTKGSEVPLIRRVPAELDATKIGIPF